MAAMRLPLWLKFVWTIWVAVWAPLYWKHYGAQNFLYFCDLGNLLIAVALWLESPLIFSWQATGLSYSKVSTPSICWERSSAAGTSSAERNTCSTAGFPCISAF